VAYLLGVEGFALLRAFTGEFDRAFVAERIAEVRAVLSDPTAVGEAVEVAPLTTVEGYRPWAPTYDAPGNQMIDVEQPVVWEILGRLPVGDALDAACGTGRHTAFLASAGHRVVGVDSSPDMLAVARSRVPDVTFCGGELARLPFPDGRFDLVVCALALAHVESLEPVFAEFARVLRPGGRLVVSDPHVLTTYVPANPFPTAFPDGTYGALPTYRHLTADYLGAALPHGLAVRRCEEPLRPPHVPAPQGEPPPWPRGLPYDETIGIALAGTPVVVVWEFELAG
jgi:SAM-dependent methyltransferase